MLLLTKDGECLGNVVSYYNDNLSEVPNLICCAVSAVNGIAFQGQHASTKTTLDGGEARKHSNRYLLHYIIDNYERMLVA